MNISEENTQLPDYSNIKVVFIGCGNIAYYHYDVLNSLKIKIAAASARKNSDSLKKFVDKYPSVKSYDNYHKMIKENKPDAVFVLTSWDQTEKVVSDIAEYGLPLFIEKPLALSSDQIKFLIDRFPDMMDKIQIGYNRRFYEFVQILKDKLNNVKIDSVEINIPETTLECNDNNWLRYLLLHNSSHVLDLLFYLLGGIDVNILSHIKHVDKEFNRLRGYNTFMLYKNSLPIHLIANWDTPANFAIKFFSRNLLFELMPIEIFTLYQGFQIIEPTIENPIRVYKPKIMERHFVDTKFNFKPGFLKQNINFFESSVLKNYKNVIGSNLESALTLTEFCEKIM